jgi:hypothetical protein
MATDVTTEVVMKPTTVETSCTITCNMCAKSITFDPREGYTPEAEEAATWHNISVSGGWASEYPGDMCVATIDLCGACTRKLFEDICVVEPYFHNSLFPNFEEE